MRYIPGTMARVDMLAARSNKRLAETDEEGEAILQVLWGVSELECLSFADRVEYRLAWYDVGDGQEADPGDDEIEAVRQDFDTWDGELVNRGWSYREAVRFGNGDAYRVIIITRRP